MRKLLTVFLVYLAFVNMSYSETYYSRQTGAWNNNSTWSTESYDGPAAATFPNTATDIVNIGNSKTVTLDQNRNVNTVIVGNSGKLVFGTFVLSGNIFQVNIGGIIEIGSPAGITQSAAAGNVQTTFRYYNFGNHNTGTYIYTGSAATTGDGLPTVMQSLEIRLTAGNVINLISTINVTGDLVITTGTLDATNMTIGIGGNFVNNSAFTGLYSTVSFNGINPQNIQGTTATTFYDLHIIKSTGSMKLMNNIVCNGDILLVSNTVLDQNGFNITLSPASRIFSDYSEGLEFRNEKHISQPGSSVIIKQFTASTVLPDTTLYPVGINGVLSPFRMIIYNGTIINNATVSVKVYGVEQPNVLKKNVSLKKYWDIATTGTLTLSLLGVDLQFGYAATDIVGNPEKYHVFMYKSPKWYMDPGVLENSTDNSRKLVISKRVSDVLAGSWTAGELKTGRYTYYSRANGNYENFNTWSTESHTGASATKAPDNELDLVMIGAGHTVNLTQNPTPASEIQVEKSGTLLLNSYFIPSTVETFRLLEGGAIGISSAEGISSISNSGAIRSANEFLGEGGIFIYTGSANQVIGLGMPDKIGALIINKDNENAVVKASKSVSINDSLVINNGVLDQTDMYYELNGTDADFSKIIMRGGTLKLWGSFPDGYAPAVFKYGTVEYTENGQSSLIKGIADEIKQYNNLKLTGNRGIKTIMFNPADTINIFGTFKIDKLEFSSAQGERFITEGSTICFNGDEEQLIPLRCKTDSAWMKLKYYNLKIAGKGIKKLSDSNHTVYNDVILLSGSLDMNGRKLDVYGNWTNTGAGFINSTKQPVGFYNLEKDSVNYIKSTGMEFSDIVFNGPGIYKISDDIKANSLTIESNGVFNGASGTVRLKGNWANKGTFIPEQSTVSFEGESNQSITCSTPEKFNNLAVNNNKEVLFDDIAGNSIHVQSTLIFNKGLINADGNGRFVRVDSGVVQSGDGRVWGPLRMYVKPGSSKQLLFAVGSKYEYRPAMLTFEGTGGTAGYIEVYSEEVNQNFFNSNGGSGLVWDKSIQLKWDITIPQGSTFGLGSRKFNTQLGWTESDLTAFANPMKFNMMRLTNGVWYKANVVERNNYFTRATMLDGFGSFITGEPLNTDITTYYSRSDGFWFNPSTWSTTGFDGTAATSAPTQEDNVLIGNGKTVTLDNNVTVGESVSVIVYGGENPGSLDCRKFSISGEGAFNLQDNSTLIIGSPDGISKSAATGNIRTKTRNFNESGTVKSNFIYSSDEPQHTGDGLPPEIKDFTVKQNEITLDYSIKVNNKLLIESGSLVNSAGTSNLTIAGDFITKSGSTLDLGNGEIIFTGSKEQILSIADDKIKSNKVKIDKESGLVIVENDNFIVNKNLDLKSGVINVRLNNKHVALPKDAVALSDKGLVDGKVIKFFNSSFNEPFTYPIGEGTDYTPVLLDVNDMSGNQGYIGAISQKGVHPNMATSGLKPDKSIARIWKISAESDFEQSKIYYDMTISYLPADLPAGTDFNKLQVKSFSGSQWHPVTVTTRELGSISVTGLENPDAEYIIGEDGGTGIGDIHISGNVIAYPMPANDRVYISFYAETPEFAVIKIYDLLGVEISKVTAEELTRGMNIIPVSMSEFNAGSYFYKLTVNGKDYMGSIIKTK